MWLQGEQCDKSHTFGEHTKRKHSGQSRQVKTTIERECSNQTALSMQRACLQSGPQEPQEGLPAERIAKLLTTLGGVSGNKGRIRRECMGHQKSTEKEGKEKEEQKIHCCRI